MLQEMLKMDKFRNYALVGAGGKTTLIRRLTEGLRKKKKILVSSTTTFLKPGFRVYDFLDYSYVRDYDLASVDHPGVYIIGKGKNQEDLMLGLESEDIAAISEAFDNSIIECDFSNGRRLKGFRDFEPRIPPSTDVTIGIVDIQSLGLQVNAANIHHLDKFIELTGSSIGSLVTIDNLTRIIDDPRALFKDAQGKRVLFINKVEKELDEALSAKLLESIDLQRLHLVIEGSLIENRYLVLYEEGFTQDGGVDHDLSDRQ